MASSITSAGSASGMDFESIIAASVKAKRTQLENRTTKKKEETNITLSGVGKLKSALETFQKSLKSLTEDGGFNTRKVTSDQPKENPYFSISTKDDAANGSYDIAVKQLSSTEKISQTIGKGEKIGKGDIKITLPGIKDENGEWVNNEETREITIEISEDMTAAQLRRKINEVAGDYGISASIVSTDEGDKLTIDSGISGANGGGMKIEYTADSGSDAGFGSKLNYDSMSSAVTEDGKHGNWDVKAGKDAIIDVDGQELRSKTNEFKNISGITINVHRTSEKDGEDGFKTNNATIEADYEAVTKKMQEFVNAYNGLMDTMDKLYKHNTYTDGKNNYDGGELSGDSMLRSLKGQLEGLVSNMQASGDVDIYSLGLEIDRDGKMKLDTTKFQEGLKENFNGVVNLFTKDAGKDASETEKATNGLLIKLKSSIDEYTKSDGIIKKREEELNKTIKDYEAQEADNAVYLEEYEAGLRQKYGKLDTMIAGYNNSLNYLYSALG